MLDGGGLAASWNTAGGEGVPRTVLRVCANSGQPRGPEVILPSTAAGEGDIDPHLAPGPEGGFVLAWTGNEGPTRDVFVAWFDAQGQHVGGPLYVTVKHNEQDYSHLLRLSDGTHVVVWEDDISGRDHIHARALDVASGRLGPQVTLNQRESVYVEDRTDPWLAPLGEGFLCVWSDRRRGLGLDVYARVLGPAWAPLEGR